MQKPPTIKQVERCIRKVAADLGILRHPWMFKIHSVEKDKLGDGDLVVHASCNVGAQYKLADFYFDLKSDGWTGSRETLYGTVLHELAHVIVSGMALFTQRMIESHTKDKKTRKLLTQLATDAEESAVTIIERIPALGAYDE